MNSARGTLRFLGCAAVLMALATPAYCQLTIAPSSLQGGVVTEFYSASISASSTVVGTPITLTLLSGAPPPGLTFAASGATATITGTPMAAGSSSFTVQASQPGLPSGPPVTYTLTQAYTIVIESLLSVTTSSLAQATIGIGYSQQLEATGGVPPYSWFLGVPDFRAKPAAQFARGRISPAVAGGSLPPGLTLSSSGLIAGTPTATGTYTFTVTVHDSSTNPEQFASATFSITVSPPAPLIITTTSPLPGGTVGKLYSIPLRAEGGTVPYTWTLASGTIPPGLTLGAAGSLTGTPTQAGNYTFALTVTDVSGTAATATFTLAIATAFSITTQSLTPGQVGVAYSAQINVTATTAPYSFSVAAGGALPAGLSLSASSTVPAGTLSGTPTAVGSFSFTIVAMDSANQSASQSYTLVIGPAPITIAPATLPNGTLGSPYSQQLTATGGAGGYVFSLGLGALPGGITLNSSGLLSGTPTALGTFGFSVTVTDSKQTTVTQGCQLTITAPPVSTPTVTGVSSTEPSAQQPTISVKIGQPYPVPLTGTITLTFASAVGNVDDPAIQFSTGGRSVTFGIPAGQTLAVFLPFETVSIDTGTIAGTITLTLDLKADGQDVTPQPAPTQVITIAPAAPVISNVTVSTTSGGIEVDVTGFSNTREMVSAAFTFQAASGTTLQGGTQTITAGPLFATWYSNATSDQYGSQFTFAQPFTISGSGVTSVSVTLTNTQGTSSAMSASVP